MYHLQNTVTLIKVISESETHQLKNNVVIHTSGITGVLTTAFFLLSSVTRVSWVL